MFKKLSFNYQHKIPFPGVHLPSLNRNYVQLSDWMMLKLKLQYFGHLMRRVDSLEKTLMLGGIGGRRRRGQQRMRWLDGITDSTDVESEWTPGVGDGQGGLACCDSWGRKESDTTEQLIWSDLIWSSDWTTKPDTINKNQQWIAKHLRRHFRKVF